MREIQALQSQIDLNTNEIYKLTRYLDFMISEKKSSKLCRQIYNCEINTHKRKIKQLAENQRVLKSIIGKYITADRSSKE